MNPFYAAGGYPMSGVMPVSGGGMGHPLALAGHIPETFADQEIKFRVPYTMYGEVLLTPSTPAQFMPEGSFRHALDKPIEIWRMRTILTAVNDAATPVVYEPQPETLGRRVRMTLRDLAKDQVITSAPSMIDGLQTTNFGTWEWDVPYTLTRSEGFVIQLDTVAFPLVCVNEAADGQNCTSISRQVERVICSVAFQGFLLVLQPASESR